MATLARRAGKTVLFIILFCLSAKMLDASKFISADTSANFSYWLYGYSSQENFDDLWFFVDVGGALLSTIVCYNIIILIIRKMRR
jgi:hypothetical protein